MHKTPRTKVLTAALWAALAAGPSALANAAAESSREGGLQLWMIEFAEPGLLEFQRNLRGAEFQRFDLQETRTQARKAELMASQAERKTQIETAARRPVEFQHHYLITHSGVAAWLSAEEAAAVRSLPGIASVEPDREYELATFNGPVFIGAGELWFGGPYLPNGIEARGQGLIAGVLDTGLVNNNHPSFRNDPSCGHGTVYPPKVISSVDCGATNTQGLCVGTNPVDTNGHGTHVAGIMAGNIIDTSVTPPPTLPTGTTFMSGVAPCASIRSYKVCPTSSCPGANIQAGMNHVLAHGDVDVMNFSISGGTNPWNDADRRKLDIVTAGTFVAASAGNTSTTITNPIGTVNHRGPWVLSVANSTHDFQANALLTATGANLNNIGMTRGSDSPNGTSLTDFPIRRFPGQNPDAEGCSATTPAFTPGFFNGSAALIRRGSCPFTEKINNAHAAGAELVIIFNNQTGAINMSTPGQAQIPAWAIEQTPGNALRDYVDANPTSAVFSLDLVAGDVLNASSLRGPTPAPLQNLTKPDITAPGTSIYAAHTSAGGYASLTGTSMSGPHAAGAALLVRELRRDWTVAEVRSALMMTASRPGRKPDVVTPWDWDDVGSGRVDLRHAPNAGLVMDEVFDNYLAANPALPNGDVRTLNLPSLRDMNCTPSCTFTRTLRNTLPGPSSWTATGVEITPGVDIEITPSSFSFAGTGVLPSMDSLFAAGFQEPEQIEEITLTITVRPQGDLTSAVAFGRVDLVEDDGRSPDLHLTVSIRGSGN